MTRRTAMTLLASSLARAAGRLPANKNVRWALGSNLWNYFPRVPFTDILDVMKDTGFIGVRVTQFPQILTIYNITAAQLEKEVSKRNLHVITISFNGPAQDPARRAEIIANAKKAMGFLKTFGASRLVVFSPSRSAGSGEAAFKTMCECYNQLGEAAGEMGLQAGLHNHLNQMVQDAAKIDKCMAMTDPKLFSFSPDTAHLFLARKFQGKVAGETEAFDVAAVSSGHPCQSTVHWQASIFTPTLCLCAGAHKPRSTSAHEMPKSAPLCQRRWHSKNFFIMEPNETQLQEIARLVDEGK